VFTVPSQIEVIAFQNQTVVYDILFRAALSLSTERDVLSAFSDHGI